MKQNHAHIFKWTFTSFFQKRNLFSHRGKSEHTLSALGLNVIKVNQTKEKNFQEDMKEEKVAVFFTPWGVWPCSAGVVYSLEWLSAQCEVSLSTQMLSDSLRGTRLTVAFFAIDNRWWEQTVCLCAGRDGVNSYLSGLPQSGGEPHSWGNRRKWKQSVLSWRNFFY